VDKKLDDLHHEPKHSEKHELHQNNHLTPLATTSYPKKSQDSKLMHIILNKSDLKRVQRSRKLIRRLIRLANQVEHNFQVVLKHLD